MKKEIKRRFLLNEDQFNKLLNDASSYITIDTLQGYLFPFDRNFDMCVNLNHINNNTENTFCNFSITAKNPDDPYEQKVITFNLTFERACELFKHCEYSLRKTKYLLWNPNSKEVVKINDKYILSIFFKDKYEMMNYKPNFEFYEEITLNEDYNEFNFAEPVENIESETSEMNIFIKDEVMKEFDSDDLSACFVSRTF